MRALLNCKPSLINLVGHSKTMEHLISNMKTKSSSNKPDMTLPFVAALMNSTKMMKLFIEYQFDLLTKTKTGGETVFHAAASSGNLEILELCLEHSPNGLNVTNSFNSTPLHYACLNGHVEIVRFLLEQKYVDINAMGQNGYSPLHYACENKYFEIGELLLNHKIINLQKYCWKMKTSMSMQSVIMEC